MAALEKLSSLESDKLNYKIQSILGSGSFGITYLATTNVAIKGPLGVIEAPIRVAIKEFYISEINTRENNGNVKGNDTKIAKDYLRRFRREAEHIASLSHPNIVKVLDVFDKNNTTYYSMEYIDGENLFDYIERRGMLDEKEALSIATELGKALSYMHENHMLHLDVKPKNVMRTADGRIVLIDFGLSKHFDDSGNPESSTSVSPGTPGYAAPERTRGMSATAFDATLDVYSLGATIFKMLTGNTPPLAAEIVENGFPKNILVTHGVSPHIIDCLRRSMDPVGVNRYQTVESFVRALSVVSDTPKNPDADKVDTEPRLTEDNLLPIPNKYIDINVRRNDKGVSYSFHLAFEEPCTAKIYKGGELLLDESWPQGVSGDVMRSLNSNGLLSPLHWENEAAFTLHDDHGTAECIFSYNDGTVFVRNSPITYGTQLGLLYNALEYLVSSTSLHRWIKKALNAPVDDNSEDNIIEIEPEIDEGTDIIYKPQSNDAQEEERTIVVDYSATNGANNHEQEIVHEQVVQNPPVNNHPEDNNDEDGKKSSLGTVLFYVAIAGLAVVSFLVFKGVFRGGSDDATQQEIIAADTVSYNEEQQIKDYIDEPVELHNVRNRSIFDEKGNVVYTYTGSMSSDDFPHGNGEATFATTDPMHRKYYKGNFIHGVFHGHGHIEYVNGNYFIGTFEYGHMKKGRYYVAKSNQTFNGSFENDRPFTGFWTDSQNRHVAQVNNGMETK